MSDHLDDMTCGSDGPVDAALISVYHLARAIGAPLIGIDISSCITFINSAAEKVIGRPAAEVAGLEICSLFTEESGRPDRALAKAVQSCLSDEDVRSATAVMSTPSGPSPIRLTVVPMVQGMSGGTVAVLIGRPRREVDDFSAERSMDLLVAGTPEMAEGDDLHILLGEELGRVVETLGIDLAAARFIGPGGRPLLVCRGIDAREARELLSIGGPDGVPLFDAVAGCDCIVSDQESDGVFQPPCGITSFAAYPIHMQLGDGGCAVFGARGAASVRQYSRILQVLCNQINIGLRNHALNAELKKRNTQLRGLYETSKAVSTSLDLNDVLQTIVGIAMSLVDAENCFVFELDRDKGKLRILSMMTQWPIDPTIELDLDEGLVGIVASNGAGILAPRADLDPRAKHLEDTPDTPSSMIVVPLIFNDRTLGVMSLEKTPGVPFDEAQYELIELFSVQAAMAINNAYMFGDLQRTASSLQMFNVLLTHDVANFNVPIHGFLEMLLRDPTLDARQHRYVHSALVQSGNISELISDVRQLFALRSQRNGWSLEPVDMIPVIREAMRDIFVNAAYEDVETTFESTVDRADVLANALLKGLFYNLLSNACKYGLGKPVNIKVDGLEQNGRMWWRVAIEDHGKGIPEDMKARLFKRFDRLDTSHAAEGHGLGLSVVKELVRHYGGMVWVEDRVPGDHGQGARVVVLMPQHTGSEWPEG